MPNQPVFIARRQLLGLGLVAPLWPLSSAARAATEAAPPKRRELRFPRDLGSHPDFGVEWWYLTGFASSGARQFGFQITFFRSRVAATQAMTSAFAAKQIFFAHAAVTDVQGKKFWHDERMARASGAAAVDLAAASEADTDVRLRDWSLARESPATADAKSHSHYRAQVAGRDFALDLQFTPNQALLLQGEHGWSRKGRQTAQGSYYYSLPQLEVAGQITLQGKKFELDAKAPGRAWLDHEWSQALLAPQAVGWDWIGMNLFDGSALTAFQVRDQAGQALWAGGSFRSSTPGASPRIFAHDELQFEPVRLWSSPLTQGRYPVEWIVQTPLNSYRIKAVIDNQEQGSRASTGIIYWEGLSELFDPQGKLLGRGYLEMTGYAGALRL